MSERCLVDNTSQSFETTPPAPRRTIRKMPKQSSLSNASTQSHSNQDPPTSPQTTNSSPRQPRKPSIDTITTTKAFETTSLAESAASPASPRGKHYFSHSQGNNPEQSYQPSTQASSAPFISSPLPSSYSHSRNSSNTSLNLTRGNEGLGIPDIAFEGEEPTLTSSSAAKSLSGHQPDSEHSSAKKSGKGVFSNLINRSRSTRSEEISVPKNQSKVKPRTPYLEPETRPRNIPESPKTAPMEYERGYRDMMGSSMRNKSADRTIGSHEEDVPPPAVRKDSGKLLHNIKHTGTKAAGDVGRAGKGFFSKLTRSGSATERDVHTEEQHVFTVINLPLVEQTRVTRITARMELARDKTEFWMPALPWRCIDYLNLKGVEEEGLYRIPGSGREVKRWQIRFDIDHDVNLLDEPDLYDINIIGSMLKSWLRELPDELFPRSIQKEIEDNCRGAQETPQMLRDELSKLPPYNYYMLFAITCHISVLYMNHEKNKMNYHNLCICFQPCMRIDAFCFFFLVCDWKNCWQGCSTEREYLELEYSVLEGTPMPTSSAGQSYAPSYATDEHVMGSSMTSRPTTSEERSTRDQEGYLMPTSAPQSYRKASEAGTSGAGHHGRAGLSVSPALSPASAVSSNRM